MNHEFWYLSRAAGFTAYLLLFVSVALGIAIGTRLGDRIARRNTIFDLHRFTTILALAFTLFHVYILLGDSFFSFNVWQLSVPFLSPYRTWQTAAGVLALYTTIILVASFYVRRFIGYRAWRTLHFATFVLYGTATLHSITAGTDTSEPWAKLLYISTALVTLALILYRIQYHMPDVPALRTVRLASAIGVVVTAILLLTATGLLTAGRPASSTSAEIELQPPVPDSATSQATADPYPFLASFDNDVSGNYVQTQDSTSAHLTLDGVATGDLSMKLHVQVDQTIAVPTPDNEVGENDPNDNEQREAQPQATVVLNEAEMLDSATGAVLCAGQLTSLSGGQLRFTCDGMGPYRGVRITISGSVRPSSDGTFSGALSGNMQRLA